MNAELINDLVLKIVKQNRVDKHTVVFTELQVKANTTLSLPSYNNYLILVGNPPNIEIESDYGNYNTGNQNIHVHRGQVNIKNLDEFQPVNVTFQKIIFQT